MKITKASKNEIPQLKQIWFDTFNNSKNFIDDFFENRWDIDNCYIIKENDTILSTIHCLQFSFTREMNTTEVSYIVGATTIEAFRNQGLLSNLLDYAHKEEGKILTLNPSFNPFFEKHGFYYSSNSIIHKLSSKSNMPIIDEKIDISTIYINATQEFGSLDRDNYSWKTLQSISKTVVAEHKGEKAYALIINNIAFETMCEGIDSAKKLKEKLESLNISHAWMPSNSPLSYLFDSPNNFIPQGMSSEKNICANLYIPQQF